MAFIDFCKKGSDRAAVESVCLTGGDCIVLLPLVRKELEKARKKVEYYTDRICDGYGTKSQEDKLIMYENILESLESIDRAISSITCKRN